eukprot:TRINITY_DN3614_c0_g1_i2.p1 TRINITY_DN3614_c0_g1~~TRINITY_DN3614_c0_g1_i2.p1  ORF type:complete len:229 (+),score=41.35 TRINITY_DN3614_c0_g1_i2:45-689(+)
MTTAGAYDCELCGGRVPSLAQQAQHETGYTHSLAVEMRDDAQRGVRTFACKYCDAGFRLHRLLAEHSVAHHSDKLLQCVQCSVGKFVFESNYEKHVEYHKSVAAGNKKRKAESSPSKGAPELPKSTQKARKPEIKVVENELTKTGAATTDVTTEATTTTEPTTTEPTAKAPTQAEGENIEIPPVQPSIPLDPGEAPVPSPPPAADDQPTESNTK